MTGPYWNQCIVGHKTNAKGEVEDRSFCRAVPEREARSQWSASTQEEREKRMSTASLIAHARDWRERNAAFLHP